jgi:hypothetical protein
LPNLQVINRDIHAAKCAAERGTGWRQAVQTSLRKQALPRDHSCGQR